MHCATVLYPEVSSRLLFAQSMELGASYLLRRVAHFAATIPKHVPEVKRSIEREWVGRDFDLIATLLAEGAAKMGETIEAP